MMSGIRGRDTRPEIQIRKFLHSEGFRFRLHVKALPGCPDVVLPKYRAVVFVNGCFWHGHGCHLFKLPATRTEFWKTKISRNHENDGRALRELATAGWRTAVIWECSLKGKTRLDPAVLVGLVCDWIRGSEQAIEIPV